MTTNFELPYDEDVINEAYLDKKIQKRGSFIDFRKKQEFKARNNKQSVEEVLTQRVVKTTMQILYDKGLFDNCNHGNAYEVLEDFMFDERRTPDLEEVNNDNDVIQYNLF